MALRVQLLREGNLLAVRPLTDPLIALVERTLTYKYVRQLHGAERYERGRSVEIVPTECFRVLPRRIVTNFGYYRLLRDTLTQAGYKVVFKDISPAKDPAIFKPYWDRLKGVEFRYKQREAIELLIKRQHGRITCPVGWGKSFILGQTARVLPKATFDITTKSAAVARTIFKDLCQYLPDVGLMGAGGHSRGRRVTVYCAKSLHHSPGTADYLIGDEVHELGAASFGTVLANFRYSRMFGFSASNDKRMDGADFEVQGLFGPIILAVDYQKAVEQETVVPIEVVWRYVDMDVDPVAGLEGVPKKRYGIWRNRHRNEIIAEDARSYGDEDQVLITTETIEHAMYLKKLLPEFTLVYSPKGLDPQDRLYYVRKKFISEDEPEMTFKRAVHLQDEFEQARLKKVIATTVWNRGVNFRQLQVIIRADAGGSAINDDQIPGRTARLHNESGKDCGIVRDYVDNFDRGFRMRSRGRYVNYGKHGWEQYLVRAGKKSLFNKQRSLWEGI